MRMRGCRFELQRVLFEKLQKQKVVVQNRCIFDVILVNPKCVWEAVVYMKNCKQTAKNVNKLLENWNNLLPLKPILALPTWGQICTNSELQPFPFAILQMEHPV